MKRLQSLTRSQSLLAMVFLLPSFIGFFGFFVWPAARGLYLSFTEYDMLRDAEWVGLENYEKLLSDEIFFNSIWVTLEYVAINIGVQTVLALLLAVLLHRFTKSVALRGIVLLPYLIANVIVALVWFWLADYNLGLINSTLDWLGIERIGFFGSEDLTMPTIALINVWRHMGYTALLIFAGLVAIPRDVYEAAGVDGAGEWRIFRSVTLPLLRPVLAFVMVVSVVGSFQIYDTIAVTTGGGPVHASRAINVYIFQQAFEQRNFGYAAAMAVILMIFLAGVAFAQNKLLKANQNDLDR